MCRRQRWGLDIDVLAIALGGLAVKISRIFLVTPDYDWYGLGKSFITHFVLGHDRQRWGLTLDVLATPLGGLAVEISLTFLEPLNVIIIDRGSLLPLALSSAMVANVGT